MQSKLSTITLCLGFFCIVVACSPPRPEEPEIKFKSAAKINVNPLKKLYRMGDTIWLDYSIPGKMLKNITTGQVMSTDSLSLQFQVSFNPIHAPNAQEPFCRYISEGTRNSYPILGQNGTGTYGAFGCDSTNSSNFRIGIIPAKRGIFGVFISETLHGVYNCRTNPILPTAGVFYKFDAGNGNKDIYLNIPKGVLPDEVPKGTLARWIDEKRVIIIEVE